MKRKKKTKSKYSKNQVNAQTFQTYGTAVVATVSSSEVVVNQPAPEVALSALNPDIYKIAPVTVKCPFCKKVVTTSVETSCSCAACCFCCWTGYLIYMCIQCCRNKDICCCNAEHSCPSCGKQIGHYSAC